MVQEGENGKVVEIDDAAEHKKVEVWLDWGPLKGVQRS